jgi:hypothetical protein
VVNIHIAVFWHVALCHSSDGHQYFGRSLDRVLSLLQFPLICTQLPSNLLIPPNRILTLFAKVRFCETSFASLRNIGVLFNCWMQVALVFAQFRKRGASTGEQRGAGGHVFPERTWRQALKTLVEHYEGFVTKSTQASLEINLVCNGLANVLEVHCVSSGLCGAEVDFLRIMEVAEKARLNSCQNLDGKGM